MGTKLPKMGKILQGWAWVMQLKHNIYSFRPYIYIISCYKLGKKISQYDSRWPGRDLIIPVQHTILGTHEAPSHPSKGLNKMAGTGNRVAIITGKFFL